MTDEFKGFSRLSQLFKSDPTIENYVALRRENPDEEIEVAIFGGLDPWIALKDKRRDELKLSGIKSSLLLNVMDADEAAISELSLQLLEKLIERKKLQKNGETHLVGRDAAISDALIDYLIKCMLDAMEWTGSLTIPRDLIVLIRERLGGPSSKYRVDAEIKMHRDSAKLIAARFLAAGKKPTFRLIGKALGVDASTVKRWFPDGDMMSEAEKYADLLPLVDELRELWKKRKPDGD